MAISGFDIFWRCAFCSLYLRPNCADLAVFSAGLSGSIESGFSLYLSVIFQNQTVPGVAPTSVIQGKFENLTGFNEEMLVCGLML